MFQVGIDYSPNCIALVTSLRSNDKFTSKAIVFGEEVKEDELEIYNRRRWGVYIYHQVRHEDNIQHYRHIQRFMIETIQAWMNINHREPLIGIEDNLHAYTGSNQYAQMAEMKTALALACEEQGWRYSLINASTARALWIRMAPNIQVEWRGRSELSIKKKLRELFGLPARQGFTFKALRRPYHDIIDAFIQQQVVSSIPVMGPRENKYATRLLRDFIRR
jgi:hypothetical protein